MKDSTTSKFNFINNLLNYIKIKYKFLLIFLILVFLVFIGYQYHAYYKFNNILQNSITYFNSKKIEPNEGYYEIIKELSKSKDFYAIISQLELINLLFNENKVTEANNLYLNLLNKKKLNNIYKSSIAAHAAYNNLNIMYENMNSNLRSNIVDFIGYIDDNLQGYIGIKLELKYLLAVSDQDINDISSINDKKTNDLYELIQKSENVPSTIKERVKSIHEFQKYK